MGEMALADIAAVTDRDNNAFGGNNGGMWIFALLILLMMGGGYWNKGNQNGGGEPVTESGLCSAMNFNGLENSVGRLNDSLLTGLGYYDIAAGATLSGSAAGTITLTAYQDGVAIPGMTASQTVKAAGDIVTLGISGIIRNYCTKPVSTLTIVVSGIAATGTNLAIDITKQ